MSLDILFPNFHQLIQTPEDVQRLDQAILQLAVQGKLASQDPNDEPAGELLRRIGLEKKQLVDEGKIKKPKRLRSIGEDVPFCVPQAWEWTRVGEIALNVHYGYTASADMSLHDYRMLRITDIQNDHVEWDSVPGCRIKPEDADKYLLHENDIVIARTGGTVGKSYIVQNLTLNAVFASYLIRVIPPANLFARYLKLFLGSRLYWDQLIEGSKGTGQPNVNASTLSLLLLPLPPLAEQHRIVAKVDQLMALCDALEAKLSRAQTLQANLTAATLHHALEAA